MNLFFCLIGLALWILPVAKTSRTLDQDTILSKYYDKEGINQMNSIVTFFDEYVQSNCQGGSKITVCYQQFFDRLYDPDNFNIGVSFDEQSEFYLQKLSPRVFNSIWSYSQARVKLADGQLQYYNSINYNALGEYRKFLKDVSEEEPYFKKYVEPIETAGDLSPSSFKGFLYDPSGLDFSDERHRLILAIHFLTFNHKIATTPK